MKWKDTYRISIIRGKLVFKNREGFFSEKEYVVSRGLNGNLFIYTLGDWSKFEQMLKDLVEKDEKHIPMRNFFVAGAIEVEVEREKRVAIPNSLLEFAKLPRIRSMELELVPRKYCYEITQC